MIIDGHHHLAGDPEPVVARMDALGIDRTVLVGVGVRDLSVVTVRDSVIFRSPFLVRTVAVWKARRLVRSRAFREALLPDPVNDRVLEAIRARPDRLLGFAFLNPGTDRALPELDRCLAAGMRGAKLALLQYPASLAGPRLAAIADRAAAACAPLFVHLGVTPSTADPSPLIRAIPDLTLILAHAGVQHFEHAEALARRHARVFLDTSSYFVTPAKLRRLCRTVGPSKLVFGSDVPVMALDPGEALRKILDLPISAEGKDRILGGNLREMLGEV